MSPATTKGHPIKLVLDFDGTLSKTDTLKPLAEIGYAHAARETPSRHLTPWSEIVDAYMADYRKHDESYSPGKGDRKSFEQQRDWLNSLLPIERASAERAVGAGVWDGVSRDEITSAAEQSIQSGEVVLREGWQELVSRVMKSKGTVDVVSVNWSRWWIWSLLRASWQQWRESKVNKGDYKEGDALRDVALFANELPHLTGPTGHVEPQQIPLGEDTELRTSGDKLRCMRRCRTGHQDKEEAAPFVIYVGDSITDLECLVEADLGICIVNINGLSGTQRELAGALDGLGVKVEGIESPIAGRRRLVTAKDFVEIESFVSGDNVGP